MKKILIILLIVLSCNDYNKTEIIEGEIFIKLIDFGSLYGASDDFKSKIKENINNPPKEDISQNDKSFSDFFKLLANHKLIDKPYFKMKLKNGLIVNIYTTENEYHKLLPKLKDLNRDKEVIKIKIEAEKKEESIYFTDNIILIDKVKGITSWKK